MTGKKYALVIGNSVYQHQDDWPELPTAEQDAAAVADLLRDPAIGGFDKVELLRNTTSSEMSLAISRLFKRQGLKKDDLLLLYFSGHGQLTDDDRLFFVNAESQRDHIEATGLDASYITGMLKSCRAKRQVIILDSCYSGKFGKGGGARLPTQRVFDGTGCYIVTSSRETQRSWEGPAIDNALENGFFTHFLLDGLKTGNADLNHDGWVDIAELYEYVSRGMAQRSAKQTPTRDFQGEGVLRIARTPTTAEERAQELLEQKLEEAEDALEIGAYDRAILLLQEVRDDPLATGILAETAIDLLREAVFEQERANEYRMVQRLVGKGRRAGQVAWRKFVAKYPDYDPDGVGNQKPKPKSTGRGQAKRPVQVIASKAILPEPFAWIEIPNKRYSMSKYLVTNGQFKLFVDGGGYNEQKWWTTQGWDYRQNENWTEPRYWQDETWNGPLQPVVGVSWFEAVAFCHWLSGESGHKIMLPTEDQWQYGAQGDDGRAYPWGNEWDGTRSQNSVSPQKSDRTSDVTFYEGKGDSPFGLVDMAGNVWEWCLTDDVNSNASTRVLRGGSWLDNDTGIFRVSNRGGINPSFRYCPWGFRLAQIFPHRFQRGSAMLGEIARH